MLDGQYRNETPIFMPKDEHIGRLIEGKYRLLSLVGAGGMVKTYLAENAHSDQLFSIKVIKKGLNIQNVLHHTRMIKKLDHPAIPQIADVVEDDNDVYIIQEYVQGKNLAVLIKEQGNIPVEAAIRWAVSLCDVLSYLHTLRPPHIHRDIKPANICILSDGIHLKLIEFSTMILYDSKTTQVSSVSGTRGYAAPEQYGGTVPTDARADIFALGMTLYHMVTGHHPAEVPFIPIHQPDLNLPKRLQDIIAQCIEWDADKRFQTAEDVKKTLLGEALSFLKLG